MRDSTTDARYVVITGASTGIGEACALLLDRKGFSVFAGVRNPEAAERLNAESSENLRTLMIDVTDIELIEEAVAGVHEVIGNNGIHGLVNNAGITIGGPLEFLPIDALREQLEVNVIGQIAVTQAFLPLIRQGNGRIVIVGSTSGWNVFPLTGAYSASKFAIEAIADTLRIELLPWNIHVSLIEPGSVKTPIWNKSLELADRIMSELPDMAFQLYGDLIQSVQKILIRRGQTGIQPKEVAQAVTHALIARRPKTRYFVGSDAKLLVAFAKYVPDRVRDALIARLIGISG